MNIKPEQVECLYDRLLVVPVFEDRARGLIVPERAKTTDRCFLAKVKVGDHVLVEKKAGFPMPIEGDAAGYLMISEMHVLAIVRDYAEPSSIITAVA